VAVSPWNKEDLSDQGKDSIIVPLKEKRTS
jgi:hypothetical protein